MELQRVLGLVRGTRSAQGPSGVGRLDQRNEICSRDLLVSVDDLSSSADRPSGVGR